MFAITTLFATLLSTMVAQAPPPPPMGVQPLQSGSCLDAPRAVPKVFQAPVMRGSQLVRIDEVVSTATMTTNEVIGFLYTTEDGTTWLGQRTPPYVSPAGATAINLVLASTHVPGKNVSEFPPQSRYGVATKYQEYFKVRIPTTALATLQVQLVPCVAWPPARALPDPTM